MYPRQSATTHTEQLGDEASVYDWARAQVHALNPTAACVWRLCDGATSPDAMAAALRRELGIAEADAVVALTLTQLARLHLLERPVASRGDRPAPTRRWLLARGVAAVMLPVISSIVAPAPVAAQSPATGAPTLTSLSPNQGLRGTTVAVTLTGTNFAVGATTVNVVGGGVTVINVVVGSGTSLTANFVLDPAAAAGARTVTVATAAGTSGALPFTIDLLPGPGTPTLTSVSPNQGLRGTTVTVTLTGTNFAVGATGVTVSGAGVTVNTVVVGSTTSLTATFVIDAAAAVGARNVTVTTAGGTSGGQSFTITLPPPGAPTLTSVTPNQGVQGSTVAVTLAGTNFVVGATTVTVSGAGVAVNTVVVNSTTSLTANFVIDAAAAVGARTVTVTTAGGTSGPQSFTITLPPPTLTSVSPNQGIRGTTVAITLTGTNFVVGATSVAVSGAGVTVTNVTVGSTTSLTANFVLDGSAALGARSVTVTTAGGTTPAVPFTINPGSMSFAFTGAGQTFSVPPGVTTLTVTARGAQGGGNLSGAGANGGSVTATLAVVPGENLDIRVGGQGGTDGTAGFNGGGAGGDGFGGGGGGASDVRRGGSALVVAGGGGGAAINPLVGGVTPGGAGGGTSGGAGGNGTTAAGVATGGGGGTQLDGGSGGINLASPGNNGQPGVSGTGGTGGTRTATSASGGGGGGGYFGGGGGAGGTGLLSGAGGGGGGSSFPAGATHTQGVRLGNGEVTITW